MYRSFSELRECLNGMSDDIYFLDAYARNLLDEEDMWRRNPEVLLEEAMDALVTVNNENYFEDWDSFVRAWIEENRDEVEIDEDDPRWEDYFEKVSKDLEGRYIWTDEGYVFQ